MTKQKILLFAVLCLAFAFSASAAYAALTFNSNSITTDSSLSLSGGDVNIGPDDSTFLPLDLQGWSAAGQLVVTNSGNSTNTGIAVETKKATGSNWGIYSTATGNNAFGAEADSFVTVDGGSSRGIAVAAGVDGAGITAPNAYGLFVYNPNLNDGGAITNNYGIFVADQTAGANNYAIKTGLGKVQFGDTLTVGPDDSQFTSNLQAWTYADNNFRQINTDPTDGHANLSVEVQSISGAEGIWGVSYVTGNVEEADGITSQAVVTGNGSKAYGSQPGAYAYGGSGSELRSVDAQTGVSTGTNANVYPLYVEIPFAFNGGTISNAVGLKIEDFSGLSVGGVKQAINYADKFIVDSTGAVTTTTVKTTPVTVSGLPTCNSGAKGTIAYVTDSNTTTWGATVAGSSTNNVGVSCNGTNWTVYSK